jgi:hypothetical protein
MDSWAFFNAVSGDELTRGWQGTDDQARALAQRWADERGEAVEFVAESRLAAYDPDDDGEGPVDGEVVEPS